uniref:Calponin-homology (CH) domain-containing protein n=1 Tax=Panagrolaimus sp. ES5 TaxID=591445 RepID=A0AC34FES9_9BILA
MADRATKSGIALEFQQKIHSKYDEQLAAQLLQWLQNVTGLSDIDTSGNVDEFCSLLKDGKVLCQLANALESGSVKKVNESKLAFKQMENVSFFLQFAQKHIDKSELFQTCDLYEAQDPNAVLTCLSALARKADKFGKPSIGPKEAHGEKRNWTAEQLKQGDAIIGLQMGSNKGATASGLNMGNFRHM